MREILLLLLIAVVPIASKVALAQDDQVWVNVLIGGKPVMAVVAAPEPYTDGPSVCSAVEGARMKDGAPIWALEFIGWKEGSGYRVRVFAVLPAQGNPGPEPLCFEGPKLKRVEFASLHLESGKGVVIEKMKDVGVKPWMLRVGPKELRY